LAGVKKTVWCFAWIILLYGKKGKGEGRDEERALLL